MDRRIDYEAVPPLEAALCESVGKPGSGFSGLRLPGMEANPQAAWPRKRPAWCPVCVSDDIAKHGEVSARREWGFGGGVMCSRHKCLLIADCPRCLQRPRYRPVAGRLRIWCTHCESFADNVLATNEIPFWPYGTPQQRQTCVTVTFSNEAGRLLLRIQSDLVAMLAGARPRSAWARALKRAQAGEVLRKLTFVMLGPLWEDAYRPPVARDARTKASALPDDWSPGSLPPAVAAPALLASVTFLAAESGTRLDGITWNRELLLDGEREEIAADTLAWHLSRSNAALIEAFFAKPLVRPFAQLLSVLRADRRGIGSAREAARRHTGVGGARRRRAHQAKIRSREDEAAREKRRVWELLYRPKERFDISRLTSSSPARPPPADDSSLEATLTVFAILGAKDDRFEPWIQPVDMMSRDVTRLLRSRYIWFWVRRHSALGANILIAVLTESADAARAENRDIVLPELSQDNADATR